MRRTLAVAVCAVVLAATCARTPHYVVLVDTYYAAAHEAGAIEESLKVTERRTGARVRGILVPPDADGKLFATLPLAGATVVLTPLLAPDVGLLARLFPESSFAVIGQVQSSAGSPVERATAILFDRTTALFAAGATLGKYAAGNDNPRHAGAAPSAAGVWVFFLADSASLRSELSTFRQGLSEGLGAGLASHAHFAVYDSPPGRDELRTAIQEARSAGATCYALFVGRQNPYCFELLAGTEAKVVTSDLMGTDAFSNEVLCSVEEPLSSAVQAVIGAGESLPGTINVQAMLENSGGNVIRPSTFREVLPTK